jgi:hypothetical protein
MPASQTPSDQTLLETIVACIENGDRLADESYDLEFREPPSLQLYVLLIAQEEIAKAFILFLIRAKIIPFNRYILRAMNDHACKQLVGLIMDYVILRWETLEELQELIRADVELGDQVPSVIESAIALLRFEKIGRWESRTWDWQEPPIYDASARHVADGKMDRRKQDALYVRIGGDGRACPPPKVTTTEIDEEKERLRNYCGLMGSLLEGNEGSRQYQKAIAVIRAMFVEGI